MKNRVYGSEMVALVSLLCLFFWSGLFSATSLDVVINEVAWMGTQASTYDEWIELFNNTGSDIDLSSWTLAFTGGEPVIALQGLIPAQSTFLLERSDDNTISDLQADQVYIGTLGNSGETLTLTDSSDQVIDVVDCSEGWFGGTNDPKATMERINPLMAGSEAESWGTNDGVTITGLDADGNPINGTPKSQNSVYAETGMTENKAQIPDGCRLQGNYPNPFNPATTIRYSVGTGNTASRTLLRVYSLMGREVATLVYEDQGPGDYSVVWNGCDSHGRDVSSGIYFCRLEINGQVVRVRKMMKIE